MFVFCCTVIENLYGGAMAEIGGGFTSCHHMAGAV